MDVQRTTPRQRPRSSPSLPQTLPKVFNCIVEDKALVAGAKSSTRNGLRQWVKSGQIRLFVPLHALEQLNNQKHTPGESERALEDIVGTLTWLDEATTKYPHAVVLQGGDETFENWSDVRKFAVPRSMFSENDIPPEDEAPLGNALSRVTTEDSEKDQLVSSPAGKQATPSAEPPSQPCSNVPETLRPLFNYILWRIHQELDPAAAMHSFIFLCNDTWKADCIRDFQVRCKRLEQLRDAIAREDRGPKTQQQPQHRSTQSGSALAENATIATLVQPKTPPTAPAAMLKSQTNVLDPDAFDRSISLTSPPKSTRGKQHSQRGRGGGTRGRARGMEGSPSPAFVDMLFAAGQSQSELALDAGPPIDPNSFERPRGGHTVRGGRKLWSPG